MRVTPCTKSAISPSPTRCGRRSCILRWQSLPAYKDDRTHDYGVVFFGSPVELLYEDLSVSVGDRCVLDTISHEEMCTFSFTEGELQGLAAFAGKPLAEKIRKKAEEA